MRQDLLDPEIWYAYKPIDMHQISNVEKQINKYFPQSYKMLMEKFNGGGPSIADFDIPNTSIGSGIGCFLSLKGGIRVYPDLDDTTSELVENFIDPPEFFPSGIIAFAETGGGDYICFDYRKEPDTDNPP